MGFATDWVHLMMKCVETVSYSILNGHPQEPFKPTRGIRQGDLSPCLFIICVEVLSTLLDNAVKTKAITGFPVARGRINIIHLLLADDSLLFCKADSLEWSRLIQVLTTYELASGQCLNKEKTSLQFSKNTLQENQKLILSVAGVKSSQAYEKYFGLLTLMRRSRSKSFKLIVDRIEQKLSNHKVKLLSQVGKEVFIKSVVQAMPTYSMSVFNLPQVLLNQINKKIRNFWWGQCEQEKKVQWVAWQTLGKVKARGGLGFRDLHSFIVAMLAKQGWRLLQQPYSLASRVLKAKYFPFCLFIKAKRRDVNHHTYGGV